MTFITYKILLMNSLMAACIIYLCVESRKDLQFEKYNYLI
jgi:hypothetical protein